VDIDDAAGMRERRWLVCATALAWLRRRQDLVAEDLPLRQLVL